MQYLNIDVCFLRRVYGDM